MAEPDQPLVGDHAVVIGISRYPRLAAEGVAADLHGPDNDARAVYDWLVDARGGRLPPENVTLIRSEDYPVDADDPQPASYRVERALQDLVERTRKRPGRRLYLYFAGHGFAPDLEEAAVFTAEATRDTPMHVYANAWLRWFRKAQRFEQSVLWVDACMNYQQSVPVQTVPVRVELGMAVPGPAFIAVAAQTKSALELAMPDGEVHGVFTWTLLKGLRSGAANRRGRVTGESLRNFLHNAMAEFLPPEVKRTAAVDLQPFVRADEGMDFVRTPFRPVYDVTVSVPGWSAGQELRIWSGGPHRQVVSHSLDGPEWTGTLVRGLYVADVPEAGLRQGFQVTGAGSVRVTVAATGPEVRVCEGSELFSLDVHVKNPATSVVVVDDEFQRVLTHTGRVIETEAPGVYKVRTLFGRDMTTSSEEVVVLDRDLVIGADDPTLLSPAPLPGDPAANHRQAALFAAVAAREGPFADADADASAVSVMGRYASASLTVEETAELPHPMAGLQLIDAAGDVAGDLTRDCQVDERRTNPVAVWERAVAPGVYYLRQTLAEDRTFEGPVIVSRGWVTQVVVRRIPGLGGGWRDSLHSTAGAVEPDDVAVFMRRSATPALPERDQVVEAARLALVQGRDVFRGGQGGELRHALLEEYEDPIAAIIGCHLLLRAMAGPAGSQADRGPGFDQAVTRLRGLLADEHTGVEHPDVHALSLRCTDPALRATGPVAAPPLFTDSWRLLVAASYERPELVPADIWARVHAFTRIGPFFIWAADPATRAAHARQLKSWIHVSDTARSALPDEHVARVGPAADLSGPRPGIVREPVPSTIRDAARQLGIPGSAATGLWEERTAVP